MNDSPVARVALVGCGAQARHLHLPAIDGNGKTGRAAVIGLAVDLAGQEDAIRGYFAGRAASPDFLFIDPGLPADQVRPRFLAACRAARIDRVVVSTEPLHHKKYILWALDGGMDVFADKPLTAIDLSGRDPVKAAELVADLEEILAAERRSAAAVTLNTPRRRHAGYAFLREYAESFVGQYQVPVSHLSIRNYEGSWYLADDYLFRENHPYRYGFGKLLHGGYHHIDLLMSLLSVNDAVPGWCPDRLRVATQHARPGDVLRQFPPARQAALLGGSSTAEQADRTRYGSCGEVDVVASVAAVQDRTVLATGSLELLVSSVSARSWFERPADPRGSSGQVRQEQVQVSVGPLLSITTSDYKVPGGWPGEGSVTNFSVQVYRNTALVGGTAFERFEFADSPGPSVDANLHRAAYRRNMSGWLDGEPPLIPLEAHRNGIRLLAGMYRAMLSQEAGAAGACDVLLAPGW
jgi:predicted dehydrogenase